MMANSIESVKSVQSVVLLNSQLDLWSLDSAKNSATLNYKLSTDSKLYTLNSQLHHPMQLLVVMLVMRAVRMVMIMSTTRLSVFFDDSFIVVFQF